jgi:hypothetical protein
MIKLNVPLLVSLIFLLPVIVVGQEIANTTKPQVLVIGDSIYSEPVASAKALMKDRVDIFFGKYASYDSATAIENFDKLLDGKKWDLIHFNFGLNDLMYKAPGIKSIRAMHKEVGGVRVATPQQYEKNLRELVQRFKGHGAELIWASTTPIVGSSGVLDEGSEVAYNKIAGKVMADNNISINDMYSHAAEIHKTSKTRNTFSYKGYPLHTPIVLSILRKLDLMQPVNGPVKIFLMVGGWSHIGGGTVFDSVKPRAGQNRGTLDDLVLDEKSSAAYRHLLNKDGIWATRSDVWVQFDRRGPKSGALGIGYGGDRKRGIGSELALGHVLGDHFDEQVCIIKTALDTPSLATDLRSAGTGQIGASYKLLLTQINNSLAKLQDKFPDYTVQSGYEIAGLVLNLGEQDSDAAIYAEYLPTFITDLRKDLEVPDLPVVIVGSGKGGRDKPEFPEIIKAQQSVAALPQFQGTVSYVETRDFWPLENARNAYRQPSYDRWYDNAESFYKMGEAIGKEMLTLLK